jgi:hypothetical protein
MISSYIVTIKLWSYLSGNFWCSRRKSSLTYRESVISWMFRRVWLYAWGRQPNSISIAVREDGLWIPSADN